MAQSTEQMRRDLEALRQECARLKGVKAELAATAVLAISDAVRASLVRASSPAARLGVNRCGSRVSLEHFTLSPDCCRAPRTRAGRAPIGCLHRSIALLARVALRCPEALHDLPDCCPATRSTQRPGVQRDSRIPP